MIYIVRHGQRGDLGPPHEVKKVELQDDPHLTDVGTY